MNVNECFALRLKLLRGFLAAVRVSVSPWVNVEKCFFVTLVISGHFLELRTAMPKAANWQMDPQWYDDGQCLDCSY